MQMTPLFSSIFIMAAMIGIGALIGWRQPLTQDRRQLMVTIIVNVAMPCIILDGIFQQEVDSRLLTEIFITFAAAVLVSCLGLAMGWLGGQALRLPGRKSRELAILSGLGNTGFIGLPLCAVLFGAKGALLAAVFDAGLDFVIWTVGVMLLQERGSLSLAGLKSLLNIPMAAIFLGLGMAGFGLQAPPVAAQLVHHLSKLASPLAMMYIGMLIPALFKSRRTMPLPVLGVPIFIKLCVFPLVTAALLTVVSLPRNVTEVVLVQTAMPTIAMASILFARYAADEEMGALTTVFSTLIGLATIPAVVMAGSYMLGFNG